MILMTTDPGQQLGRARRHACSPSVAPAAHVMGSWRRALAVRPRTAGVAVPNCGIPANATMGDMGFMGALSATKPSARHLETRTT
jgi:hypothetical protein